MSADRLVPRSRLVLTDPGELNVLGVDRIQVSNRTLRGTGSGFSIAEPLCTSSFELGRLFVSVLRTRSRLKGVQEVRRNTDDCINRGKERFFVRFGRRIEATDLSDELERCSVNFIWRDRGIEVKKHLDIATHLSETSIRTSE